ncbi:MAG: hydrogenase maturation nickel metallochaperone HypA [Burkholderiaceae bacterium]
MHELSLAGGILQVVEDAAARRSLCTRAAVPPGSGQARRVELQALRFALEAIAPGTCSKGAEVLINEPPACLVHGLQHGGGDRAARRCLPGLRRALAHAPGR